ncbi:regulatory protein RecX [Caedibacter taeniospiralis]|uniref:regulatory protein RecX n=1 Tax=Caedibacter taeniospiralis TaxID=28907 RepID=UPI000C275D86|nr:regulatory protein RecX [Caedibacter taeniospiralis]
MQKSKNERDYLFYLLSKQEYSSAQLRRKLMLRNNLSLEEIDTLLAEFVENNWQSDERYAELVLRDCLSKHYGLLRIKQKLVYEKGIESAILEKMLAMLNIDWFEQAMLCYQRKYHDQPHDLKEKHKRIQYLLRQGHSLDITLKVI